MYEIMSVHKNCFYWCYFKPGKTFITDVNDLTHTQTFVLVGFTDNWKEDYFAIAKSQGNISSKCFRLSVFKIGAIWFLRNYWLDSWNPSNVRRQKLPAKCFPKTCTNLHLSSCNVKASLQKKVSFMKKSILCSFLQLAFRDSFCIFLNSYFKIWVDFMKYVYTLSG